MSKTNKDMVAIRKKEKIKKKIKSNKIKIYMNELFLQTMSAGA